MQTRRAVDELMHVLDHRPNARVLVLETFESDAAAFHKEAIEFAYQSFPWDNPRKFMAIGRERGHQILAIDVPTYQREKSKLGPIDVVIVDNRNNVARVDRQKKFKSIEKAIRLHYPNANWFTVNPELPPLGIPKLEPPVWFCGEPLYVKAKPFPLVAQEDYAQPCRNENPQYARYCRHCGRFRGIVHI